MNAVVQLVVFAAGVVVFRWALIRSFAYFLKPLIVRNDINQLRRLRRYAFALLLVLCVLISGYCFITGDSSLDGPTVFSIVTLVAIFMAVINPDVFVSTSAAMQKLRDISNKKSGWLRGA